MQNTRKSSTDTYQGLRSFGFILAKLLLELLQAVIQMTRLELRESLLLLTDNAVAHGDK